MDLLTWHTETALAAMEKYKLGLDQPPIPDSPAKRHMAHVQAGRTVLAALTPGMPPIEQVSMKPRGGVTARILYLPQVPILQLPVLAPCVTFRQHATLFPSLSAWQVMLPEAPPAMPKSAGAENHDDGPSTSDKTKSDSLVLNLGSPSDLILNSAKGSFYWIVELDIRSAYCPTHFLSHSSATRIVADSAQRGIRTPMTVLQKTCPGLAT